MRRRRVKNDGKMIERDRPAGRLFDIVRRHDPDRFLGAVFAPAARRERLILLYAFNHELARAMEVASQPMIALIRLQWWREVVEGAARAHEIAGPLRAALDAGWFDAGDLTALIEAREAEIEPGDQAGFLATGFLAAGFLAYVRGTAGRLARIAGKTLGADDPAVEDLGTGYGITGILRAAPVLVALGRNILPPEAGRTELLEEARRLLATEAPRAALPAVLPAVLARRDLARLARGQPMRPRGLADRLAVIRAGLAGHI
jgi:phytoene synthase